MPSHKSKSDFNSKTFGFKNTKNKKGMSTKLLCRYCHAVYDGKGWIPFKKLDPKMIDQLHASVCPACHEINDHLSDGVLHLEGAGVKPHIKDIKNLIMRLGKQAEEKNILDRLERMDDDKNGMTVYTTMNQLAVKMGKAVASAYKGGRLDIQWSKRDKPVEVTWTYEKTKK